MFQLKGWGVAVSLMLPLLQLGCAADEGDSDGGSAGAAGMGGDYEGCFPSFDELAATGAPTSVHVEPPATLEVTPASPTSDPAYTATFSYSQQKIVLDADRDDFTQTLSAHAIAPSIDVVDAGKSCQIGKVELDLTVELRLVDRQGIAVESAFGKADNLGLVAPGTCTYSGTSVLQVFGPLVAKRFAAAFVGKEWRCP